MNLNFFIVDDDKSIRRVLKNIITQHNLGDVIGEADNGKDAINQIKGLSPDIVLVDLLLPLMDGIAIVSAIKEINDRIIFIMVSEVTSKEMVAKAYTKGVEYYINKPINMIEVLSVINNVKEKISMQNVIKSFERAVESMNVFKSYVGGSEAPTYSQKDRIKRVLSQLGIMGEAGSNDLVEIILLLLEEDEGVRAHLLNRKLSELYKKLNDLYAQNYEVSSNVGAIEQRIRRAITKALSNIANLGIEDYGNDLFIKYSNTLFDFKEVRMQMDHIRGKSKYNGKISVKKFIEGIMVELKNE